jgi:hypothetical protein
VTVSKKHEVLVDGEAITLEPPPSHGDADEGKVVPTSAGW